MVPLKKMLTSSLGRKYLMGASGLSLVLFLLVHLLGNLTLYSGSGDAINTYAAKLHALGPVLILAEIGLAAVILLHIIVAIQVTSENKAARLVAYEHARTKGGPTKNTVGSRNMIFSGLVLLVFLVVHIWQFRFGPKMEEGYTATVDGVMVWDLYRVVFETFQNPLWVAFYVGAMIFLGAHYRHGFWSAFQSLGAMNPRFSKPIYTLGLILAVVISAGFLFIPIYLYAIGGPAQ